MDHPILDGPVSAIRAQAEHLSLAELEVLKAAEIGGKTRKSAIALLDELIALAQPEPDPPKEDAEQSDESPAGLVEIRNVVEGSTLHLGDGRRLACGECALVSEALAAELKERGQAA